MTTVTIKRIHLLNFKHFRDYTIDFTDRTTISGANGKGKTTIFDGFTWVLFGKDSHNRTEFDIKTKDANGATIPRIPHEVTVVLDVNGEDVTLTRRLNEVWRRDKDSKGEEVFKGNETERFYNGVPCSVKEWQEKIDAIIKEDIFKYTTNPHYFTAQKPDVQRALLFKMAGGVTDAEIIASNGEFRKLFEQVGNKTLVQFEDETKSALMRVRKELTEMPARIDERKRDEVVAEDWTALEKDIADKNAELQEVEGAIADKAKAITAASEAREEIARKVAEAKRKQVERYNKVVGDAGKEYRKKQQLKADLSFQIGLCKDWDKAYDPSIKRKEEDIELLKKKREELLAEYQSINAETLTFDESQFVCPTCGREYDVADIENKKSEMAERFNADKAKRLAENKARGLDIKQQIEDFEQQIAELKEQKINSDKEIEGLQEKYNAITLNSSDDDAIAEADPEYQSLTATVQELESQLAAAPTEIADTQLQERKRTLTKELDALKARLAKREQIRKNAERIAELEAQNRNLGEEEVRLKGILYNIKEFSKARSRAISDRVNGLFRYVKFKLFETQVNGEVVEVCEATFNGVPYGDCSTGEKVVVGLDIIRAIQRHTGVSAPIFIENAEGITDYPDNVLDDFKQVISLVAIKGQPLTVKQE